MNTSSSTEAPTPPAPSYKWRLVALLWLVCCLNYADRQAISSVFPLLKREFGFGPVELGLIGSAFAWTYAIGSPIAGYLGDRLSRKRLILGGCLLWSGLTALTGACSRLWQFVTLRALVGSGETIYFPAALSLISGYHDGTTRSRALGLHQSGVYIGTIAGSALGAWLGLRLGWRPMFLIFGCAGIAVAAVLAFQVREPRRVAAAESPTLREIARALVARPMAWLLMFVFVGANFVATIFLVWTPSFLVDKFHMGLVEAGLTAVVYIQTASALGSPLGGWLADIAARRLGAAGRMLVQSAGLIGGAMFIYETAMTSRLATLAVVMALFGFCKGIYDSNIWASLYEFVEPRVRASATGLGNTLGWAGGSFGPVFVGLVTRYGRHTDPVDNMSEAIAAGAAIYLVCGAALVVMSLRVIPSTRRLGRTSTSPAG